MVHTKNGWMVDKGSARGYPRFWVQFFFHFFFSILFFDLNPIIKDVRKSNHSCNLKSMEYVSNMLHMKNDL
jgi:hypothetical protein